MKRDIGLYLDDILDAISKIEEYTADLDYVRFQYDKKTIDAVIRNFEIIGEAAKNIPDEIRAEHLSVPWKEMAGMRDKLAHEYFGIRYDVVWSTIKTRLPELKSMIQVVLQQYNANK
jgi:hypothetical protein